MLPEPDLNTQRLYPQYNLLSVFVFFLFVCFVCFWFFFFVFFFCKFKILCAVSAMAIILSLQNNHRYA